MISIMSKMYNHELKNLLRLHKEIYYIEKYMNRKCFVMHIHF